MEEDEPVPKSRKAQLLPLAYFPIDPEYNVPAALKPAESETIVEMPTSTGAPAASGSSAPWSSSSKGSRSSSPRVSTLTRRISTTSPSCSPI